MNLSLRYQVHERKEITDHLFIKQKSMQTAFITYKTKSQQAADQLQAALLQLKINGTNEKGGIE